MSIPDGIRPRNSESLSVHRQSMGPITNAATKQVIVYSFGPVVINLFRGNPASGHCRISRRDLICELDEFITFIFRQLKYFSTGIKTKISGPQFLLISVFNR